MSRLRHFQVPDLDASRLLLSASSTRHALRVLRLQVGTEVCLSDGEGRHRRGRLTGMDGDQLAVEPTGPIQAQVAKPPLHLVLAVTKRNALDRSVRMATELGATQIHLFLADRSVAKASNADRLTRLVEAAMQQCGRADRPLVEAPVDLGTALSRAPCLPIFAARPEAEPSDIEAVHGARLVIGPEGGLSCREVATLETLGATPISLGEWTLRADTAVAAGLALLSAKITKSKK